MKRGARIVRQLILSIIITVVVIGGVPSLSAAVSPTYWVSTSGSDSNGCIDSTNPLTTTAKRSIQAGIACLVSAGAVVKVRNGTYTERVTWNSGGGVAGNPVILEAENARQVFWNVPSTQADAINITGQRHITVRGFVFDGTNGKNNLVSAGYTALPVTGVDKLVNVGCVDSTIPSTCATHIRFENNEFRQSAYGLALVNALSSDITFSGNFIHHLCKVRNCNVLYAGAPNTVFENNIVEDLAGAISLWNQSAATAHNGIFRNNIFRRTGTYWSTENGTVQCCATGACPGGSEGLTCNQRMPQGFASLNGGIFISRGSGTQVYNNVFEQQSASSICVDYNATNCVVANNTIFGNLADPIKLGDLGAGIYLGNNNGGSTNCAVRNNIVYQPGATNPPPIVNLGAGNVLSNNICSSSATGCSLVGDPKFIDAARRDFHLQTDSPARNKGVTIPTVTQDLDLVLRPQEGAYDIGAFEYRSSGSQTYTLSTPKSSYAPGEAISVSWTVSPGPGNAKDWIGFYLSSNADNTKFISTDGAGHQAWTYTDGQGAGTFTIIAPSTPGTYEFRYLLNDGHTDVAASPKISYTTSSVLSPPPRFRIIP
jgi:hypothetical protein